MKYGNIEITGKKYLIEIYGEHSVREIKAEHFLPGMKYNGYDDIERNIEKLFLAAGPILVAVDAAFALSQCPLCLEPTQKNAFVMVTELYNIFPCWNCDEFAVKKSEPP